MDEALERADANYYEMMRTMAANITGGESWERDGLLCVAWGGPVAQFNVAFVTRPLDDAAGSMDEAQRFFEERSLPYVVRVRELLDPDAEAAAEAAGFRYDSTVPGMVIETSAVPPEGAPVPLRIERVATEAAVEHHAAILSTAFEVPIEIGRRYLPARLVGALDVELYVGYLDDEPVATSALFLTHATAGIANVATMPSARRRGFGEAMTWHAARRGKELGAKLANLQASQMGYPIYKRMGFRRVAGYKTYVKGR